jgi:hypothetical protein
MTSIARELGTAPDFSEAEHTIAAAFAEVFRLTPVSASLDSRSASEDSAPDAGLPRRRRTDEHASAVGARQGA